MRGEKCRLDGQFTFDLSPFVKEILFVDKTIYKCQMLREYINMDIFMQ